MMTNITNQYAYTTLGKAEDIIQFKQALKANNNTKVTNISKLHYFLLIGHFASDPYNLVNIPKKW